MKTVVHQGRLKSFKLKSEIPLPNENKYSNFKSEFNQELTEDMVSADIPFWKLQNLSIFKEVDMTQRTIGIITP